MSPNQTTYQIRTIMAIPIKSVPVLKGKAAARIERIAATNLKNASQISKFEISASTKKILANAKF